MVDVLSYNPVLHKSKHKRANFLDAGSVLPVKNQLKIMEEWINGTGLTMILKYISLEISFRKMNAAFFQNLNRILRVS